MEIWRLSGDLRSGMPGVLAWDGERLTGSREALDAVAALHRIGEVRLTPTGPTLATDPTDPVTAFAMARDVLQTSAATGDPPDLPIPEIPEGAVA